MVQFGIMKLGRLFNQIIKIGFYGLFFLTPIVFNPSRTSPSSELFELIKMLFVYAILVIIVTSWIGKMIVARKLIFKRTPFDIPLWLFLISQVISAYFSIDRHVSIFGYYSRFHGGLLSTFSYILLYHALVSNLDVVNLTKLLLVSIYSGVIVAGYGIMEKFGIDAHMWVQDVRSRVFSTLGQPNWLAAYLTILLPISISFSLINLCKSDLNNRKTQNYNLKLKNFLLVACHLSLVTLFYVCLLFTKSRSGFLAFWTTNVFFWIFTYFILNKYRKLVIRLSLFFNFSFLILNFLIRTPFVSYNKIASLDVIRPTNIEQIQLPPVNDTVINVGITDSSVIRRIVWQGAVEITRHYPVFGTGPETFAYAYYRFRPPAHNLTSEWDFLYNRSHNEFLNFAATSGLFGLICYLAIILATVVFTIKNVLVNKKKVTLDTRLLLLALLASYFNILITNFFGFSVVIVGVFFFLIPATPIITVLCPE